MKPKFTQILIGTGAMCLIYSIGKCAGVAISMMDTLRKNPELDKVSYKFKNSEFTMYRSTKGKATK